ncbi:MAG: 1-deoxy-D-xylulose-5-phosphate synthase [Propionibacteriaceae bacterium]
MPILDQIHSPADVQGLSDRQLTILAKEIRQFLIANVAQTGGHLGPNLGVVELTVALHRVFDSPNDPILFDTGHQSYVHKILTGRREQFATLRQEGGLSGYPSRSESEHDWIESSHASAALSWGEGMAKGFKLRGETDRTVVVVVGDGALTGGMAWEALNTIAVEEDLRLVIVVNDNGRSYTPTVGGLSRQLSTIRTDPRYEDVLSVVKKAVSRTPLVGKPAYDFMHGLKVGLKDFIAPQSLFADLGLKYLGPIDGHDESALEAALIQAKKYEGPVIVHAITTKGKGFAAAEDHEEDRFHAVGRIDPVTGAALSGEPEQSWTQIFAEEMVALGAQHPELVGITAAMLHPVGLGPFAQAYPERTFDVGIAEQHAVASAAGLARAGMHPVVAVYSTFLNRAFDQVLMDVALHQLGVTFVLDRAGVTGTDGASHNGMWDTSILGVIPGLQLTAPRDGQRLREALSQAVSVDNAPTVIRYCKEPVGTAIPALRTVAGTDVIRDVDNPQVVIVGYGPMVAVAVDVADQLAQHGIACQVVDPVWALPVSESLVDFARDVDLVVTIEDGGLVGGLGSRLAQELRQREIPTPVRDYGIAAEFLPHASRESLLRQLGLTVEAIAQETLARLSS